MLGLIFFNFLAFSDSTPQSGYYRDDRYNDGGYRPYYPNYRPYGREDNGYNRPDDGYNRPNGYRPTNYDGYGREDGYSKEGAYRTFGIRADSIPYSGSGRENYGYGREQAGERCPYENVDARSRVRRELISDQLINSINSTGQNQSETDQMINGPVVESLKSSPMENFFKRIVKKRETEFVSLLKAREGIDPTSSPETRHHYAYYNNRPDQGYDPLNDARYRDQRYDDPWYRDQRYNDPRYRDYGDDRYGPNYRGCRDACIWEAELACDTSRMDGVNYRGRNIARWDREVDAYYPRDKYRDVLEYFGSRAELDERGGISTIIIKRVRAEDKGVYRCYVEGGTEKDFLEIHFYPTYPDDSIKC